MGKVWDKMMSAVFQEVDDGEQEAEAPELHEERPERAKVERRPRQINEQQRDVWTETTPGAVGASHSKKGNLVSIPSQPKGMEMVLVRATSYDDMQAIAQHIKECRAVIVNFEELDKSVVQRMVDFLSGAVYALDGVPKKVSGGTFLFSSSNVDLSGQIMDAEGDLLNGAADGEGGFKPYRWVKK